MSSSISRVPLERLSEKSSPQPSQGPFQPPPKEVRLDYQPQEKQARFHACSADEVLYGGAAGGGKSLALLVEGLVQAMETPGNAVALMRRSYPELERSLIRKSLDLFPKDLCRYNATNHRWNIRTNGSDSTLEFVHCQTELDVMQYQSAEFGMLGLDELTHFSAFQFLYLRSRVRSSNAKVWPRLRCATNPGGLGHGWVRRYFKPHRPERHFQVWRPPATPEEPSPPSRCFIPATLFDNQALMRADPGYLARLQGLPALERAMLLEGSWEVFAGQAFSEWASDMHTCKPFSIPAHWRAWVCVDFGYVKPFAAYLCVSSPEGRIYVIDEIYGKEIKAGEQARKIAEQFFRQRRIDGVIVDPSMYARHGGTGKSLVELYQDTWRAMQLPSVSISSGDNDRVAGKQQFHRYLGVAPDGKPWIQFFQGRAHHAIRTIPELVTDPNRVEDVDTDGEDHSYDAIRYFLQSRPKPSDVSSSTFDLRELRNREDAEMKRRLAALDPSSRAEWERVRKYMDGRERNLRSGPDPFKTLEGMDA